MEVGCYVTVDDGGNYVTFHELTVRKKIKTIGKRSWTVRVTVSFTARFKPHRGLVFFVLSVTISKPPRMMSSSANYRPFLSSFRRIPSQESFVKLAN